MEVSDTKEVRVYTGVYMRLRLIQLLGISKAARVASIVYQSIQTLVPVPDLYPLHKGVWKWQRQVLARN